jgi:hypothetical protein
MTNGYLRWGECRGRAPGGLEGMRRGLGKKYQVQSNE